MTKLYLILVFLFLSISSEAQWNTVGSFDSIKLGHYAYAMCEDKNGNILITGDFLNKSNFYYIAKFDGSKWVELGGDNSLRAIRHIYTICTDKFGNVYAAGYIQNANLKNYVAKFDGTNWTELGSGTNELNTNNGIPKICADTFGNIYALVYRNNQTRYIAKFNGTNWSELGGVNSMQDSNVYDFIVDKKNDVYVIGNLQKDTNQVQYMKKFSNNTWTNININSRYSIPYAIHVDKNNNLYLGTNKPNSSTFYIQKYNGSTWTEIPGNFIYGNTIDAITTDSRGNIYASGFIKDDSGNYVVVKYDGSNWSDLGGKYSLNTIKRPHIDLMICDKNDNIYISGDIMYPLKSSYVLKYSSGIPPIHTSISDLNKIESYIAPNPCSSCELITSKQIDTKDYIISDIIGKQINVSFEKSPNGYKIQLPKESRGIYFFQNIQSSEVIRFLKE